MVKIPKDFYKSKWFMISVAGFLVLALGSAAAFRWLRSPDETIPVQEATPDRAKLESEGPQSLHFFFIGRSEAESDILFLNLHLDFETPAALESFQKNRLPFRNATYDFLIVQKPKKNSIRLWQKLIETDLYFHLKKTLKNSRIASLRIDSMERIY